MEEFVIANYPAMTMEQIADHLNVKFHVIHKIIHKLGISKGRKRLPKEYAFKQQLDKYEISKEIEELEKQYELNPSVSTWRRLNELEIKLQAQMDRDNIKKQRTKDAI